MFKCKISRDQITYGLKEPCALEASIIAAELIENGYRRVSNAHCIVARIDREDWLEVLARTMNCAVADFYDRNGSGVGDRWRDHYVRSYSKDHLTVAPEVVRLVVSWA